jgi:hypothetical protein
LRASVIQVKLSTTSIIQAKLSNVATIIQVELIMIFCLTNVFTGKQRRLREAYEVPVRITVIDWGSIVNMLTTAIINLRGIIVNRLSTDIIILTSFTTRPAYRA